MCVSTDYLFGHAVISHWWPWVSPLLWLPFDNLSLWQATVEPGHRWKRNTSIYHPATSGGFQIWLCAQTDTLSAPQQRVGLLIAWKLIAESYFSLCICTDPPATRLYCYLIAEFVSSVATTLCIVSFLHSEWVDSYELLNPPHLHLPCCIIPLFPIGLIIRSVLFHFLFSNSTANANCTVNILKKEWKTVWSQRLFLGSFFYFVVLCFFLL